MSAHATPDARDGEGAGISAPVARQAVQWALARLNGEPCEAQWRAWRDADPEHERAWQRIESRDRRLAPLREPLATPFVRAALPAAAATRRRVATSLALLAGAGAAGWVAHASAPHWRHLLAQYTTGHGQRLPVMLADGGTVTLNGGSALDVDYSPTARRLWLHRGEILIETAPDPARRPFWVELPQGRAVALGTRYLVRRDGEHSRIDVLAGQVSLEPRAPGAPARVLQAGEGADLHADHVGPVGPAGTDAAAWRDGMLIASNQRLADFVQALNRYSATPLVCAPDAAELRVSGSYPLQDVDWVLQTLTQVLPVRIARERRFWGGQRLTVAAR